MNGQLRLNSNTYLEAEGAKIVEVQNGSRLLTQPYDRDGYKAKKGYGSIHDVTINGGTWVGTKKFADSNVNVKNGQKTGANVILKALEAPLYYIADNAGLEGSVIINKVRESEVGVGYDAAAEEYVDMVKAGILDPVKVTRSALQNATSVASTLLTTESVVANIKEDAPAMPAGGAPGMGMM